MDLPRPSLIAVVDDDASVRQALRRLIHSLGYEAAVFANADAFLKSSEFKTAECLILDIQMSGLDGLELLSAMKALDTALPTIFITAHPVEAVRARATALPVLGVLEKPFDDQLLIKLLPKTLKVALVQR